MSAEFAAAAPLYRGRDLAALAVLGASDMISVYVRGRQRSYVAVSVALARAWASR